MKLSKKFQFNLILLAIIFAAQEQAVAASCCGGGFAIPSIITGDDKAQLTTTYSYSKIDTDVLATDIWQKRISNDSTQVYKIEMAHIFADRFQVGTSIPIQTHIIEGNTGGNSSGLGDVSTQLGYEYLPDWNYNPWRPKGIGFITLTLPTGKSIYESEDGLDSRGRGFFSLGAGTTLTKIWTKWDLNSTFEIHKAFDKVVSNSQSLGNISPNFGSSISVGSGYNIGDTRLGGSIAWFHEDAITVTGTNPSQGNEQRFATGSLIVSYMFSNQWAGTFSYSDQTLFGDPTNTTLSKSVSLSLQKRWAR